MDVTTGLLLLLIGIIAGGYGTIVGAGGGFIFVPALLLILHMDPAIAAGSGLVIVLINSLSGVVGYAKQKNIRYKTGLTIGISALPGSILGVWLLQVYSSQYFYVVFATILVALGIFLFSKNLPSSKKQKLARVAREKAEDLTDSTTEPAEKITEATQSKWLIPLGFFMGILSSYLGIGGGWLLVPILIYLFKVPTHNATATSIFSLCLYSSVGVISQLFYSSIDWMTVVWGGIGVIAGSQLGVLLSRKIPGKVIMQMLSVVLVVIGFRMYFG
ncbi:sulfite exporter TauE/SafE family protein [Radiobacillus sp. PE A8.2]|uniref:sulfite exporter TauE/SafE family protein n=1 Tax=Radiobacillus sp. PE A8.2 TaxID=3380349 RepID=UPI00389048CB